jgi:fatty acid desaturase
MQEYTIPNPNQQQIPSASNLFKIVLLIALLFASFYAAQRGATALEAAHLPHWAAFGLKWGLILLLAVWDGVMLIGMGALGHEAVHKLLFRSEYWNDLWGGILSALILAPFYANRQIHLTHHAYAHQPGLDPENEMHNRSFLGALTIGSLMGFHIHYRIILHQLLHLGDRKLALRAFKDIFFIVLAGVVYFGLVPLLGLSLRYTVVPMLLLFPLVFAWRALSDHYGIPPLLRASKNRREVLEPDDAGLARDQEKWKHEVSGWVVLTWPWLEWLWSGVNYHEVHHKYPYLSHRYLKDIFAATRSKMPYLVVNGYWRSLFNASHRKYYTTPEEVRAFLSIAGN